MMDVIPRTSSVTFDLPALITTTEPEALDAEGDDLGPASPCIDINAHIIPSTILVALLDRERELNKIVSHNRPFFSSIRQQLDPVRWAEFESVLYTKRQELPDKEWMAGIEYLLRQTSSIGTFKELVGYIENDQVFADDDGQGLVGNVDLSRIRSHPERLATLESSYPQFFINCQQILSKGQLLQLQAALIAPKSKLSDEQWYDVINRTLSPNLMDQFKEIVEYEVDVE
jgi:hypothetical protein